MPVFPADSLKRGSVGGVINAGRCHKFTVLPGFEILWNKPRLAELEEFLTLALTSLKLVIVNVG